MPSVVFQYLWSKAKMVPIDTKPIPRPWVLPLWAAVIIACGAALSFYLAGVIHTVNYGPV